MKVYYECAPCFLRQAKEALDLATDSESVKMNVMREIIEIVYSEFMPEASSNKIGTKIHRIIKEKTGNEDPFSLHKKRGNEIALKLLPEIKKIIKKNDDLESYAKAAILGNLIDFGALGVNLNVEEKIRATMEKGLAVNHVKELHEDLKAVKSVLYLADNNGEIVFDKLLIEKLKEYDVDVTIALKEKPILNDATVEDAVQIGLDKVANLVSTGTDSVGIIYGDMSEEFKIIFNEAELVISKGLGNYEGITEIELGDKPVFCLLNAKCGPTARDIGVNIGDNVVLKL
ncbi:MAG: damage-control phosphatase ARMT1 family protein [Methanobacterium sp.]